MARLDARRVDLNHAILSFRGRIGRRTYFLGLQALAVGCALAAGVSLLVSLFFRMAGLPGQWTLPAGVVAVVTLVSAFGYGAACLFAKRLHDLGRSGWWLLAPLAPGGLASVAALAGAQILPAVASGAWLTTAALVIALQYVCLLTPGSEGPNRFGAPDGESRSAAFS